MNGRLRIAAALFATAVAAASQDPPPAPISPEKADLFREVFSMVLDEYVDPKSPQDVVRGALAGAARAAGPECAYIPPEEVGAWRAAQAPSALLPVWVSQGEDFARVLAVWPGTDPKVHPGDYLRFIAGRSTYDMTYPEVVRALRGGEGDEVECIFLKPESWEMYTVRLTRRPLPPPLLTALPGGAAALAIPALGAELPADLAARLQTVKGPVLVDLRGCASGDMSAALRWAGWLAGPSASALRVVREKKEAEAVVGPGLLKGRLARVLVDSTTVRGGELLAAALAKSGAVLVGAPTAGWAPRFEDLPLSDGGLLHLATAFYAGPDGEALRGHPLRPAVELSPKEGEAPSAFWARALKAPPSPPKEASSPAPAGTAPPVKNGR